MRYLDIQLKIISVYTQSRASKRWLPQETNGSEKMLIIDFERDNPDPTVQSYWKNGELPHFSGITIGDGRMVSMGEQVLEDGNFYESYVYPIVDSTLSSFMGFSGEFVSVTEMVNRAYIPEIDCYAICGEG